MEQFCSRKAQKRGDRSEFLHTPISEIKLEPRMTVADMTRQMENAGFGAGRLARVASIWARAVEDQAARVYFALAGAMVPAGMRKVVAQAVDAGLIDFIATTGANMAHDGLQGFSSAHYKGSPSAGDTVLREQGLLRVYDIFIPRDAWDEYDNWLSHEFYPGLARTLADEQGRSKGSLLVTPSRVFHELGKWLAESRGDDGILATAYRKGVPIHCPAFIDCTYGVVLDLTNRAKTGEMGFRIKIDQTSDYSKMVEDMANAEARAAVVVGGGAPKNYLFQTSEALSERGLVRVLDIPEDRRRGFKYAVQITTDAPHWGGLSGATLEEAISWKKVDTEAPFCTVYCDATIALPMIVQRVMDELGLF